MPRTSPFVQPLRALSAAALAACLGSAAAAPTSIQPLDLRKLPHQATLVVLGQVAVVEDHSTKDDLIQDVLVEVTQVLAGHFEGPRLLLHVRRGFVFFDRILHRGDAGVFYLAAAEGGAYQAAYPGSFALFEAGVAAPVTPAGR
jgi:hypothetical protein